MSLEDNSKSIIEYVIGGIFGIATTFLTLHYDLLKRNGRRDKKRIVALKSHPLFDTLSTERLKIENTEFHLSHTEKEIALRDYLLLKMKWWKTIFTAVIEKDFKYEGLDLLTNPVIFAKWIYSKEVFGGREEYFLKEGVSQFLLSSCERLITGDIKAFTHEQVRAILSDKSFDSRYEIADAIMHVISQGIKIDNRATIKHASTLNGEWSKDLGIIEDEINAI